MTAREGFDAWLDGVDQDLATARADATDAAIARDAALARVAALDAQVALLTEERDQLLARIAELEKPDQEPAGGQRYGVSAVDPNPGETWQTAYARYARDLASTSVFYYGGSTVRWVGDLASIPEDHAIQLQTEGSGRAEFDAMFATFPRTRRGPVYITGKNEPDKPGKIVIAEWQAKQDALYTAAAASGLTYLVPSVSLMYYSLQQTLKGTTDPIRKMSTWLRPGCKHIAFSNYAEKSEKVGADGKMHEVATIDPVKMPQTIGDWCRANGYAFSSVSGWSIGNEFRSDPVTINNRVTWLRTAAGNLAAQGSLDFQWFNTNWQRGDAPGDYRIEVDPALLAAWRELNDTT